MERIVLFAKRPDPGRVKTRLEPVLGRRGALELYRALLADALDRLVDWADSARDVEVCLDRPWRPADARHAAIPRTLQGDGDLGARLLRAFERCHADKVAATVVLGADSPTLPDDLVDGAFSALRRGSDAVVAPAADGGYVLLGATRPIPELFRAVPWGRPRVFDVTRARATECGVSLVQLPGWYDIDDDASLARLRLELASSDLTSRAPRTAAWFRRREGHRPPP